MRFMNIIFPVRLEEILGVAILEGASKSGPLAAGRAPRVLRVLFATGGGFMDLSFVSANAMGTELKASRFPFVEPGATRERAVEKWSSWLEVLRASSTLTAGPTKLTVIEVKLSEAAELASRLGQLGFGLSVLECEDVPAREPAP